MAVSVVLVEDNPDDELLALDALAEAHITGVKVLRDGAEVLDYLFSTGEYAQTPVTNNVVVLLLDLKLPKVGGLEVIKRIRADEQTKRIPIIVMTSSDEERDIIDSYNNGANSYLRKPVDADTFTEVMKELAQYWINRNVRAPR